MQKNTTFHTELQKVMDEFVHSVYDISLHFPKEELFGITSQIRRSALSVVLNYTEGFARQRKSVLKNFLEIAYGSLKETKYLLKFSYERHYIQKEDFMTVMSKADRIGKMIWGILQKL